MPVTVFEVLIVVLTFVTVEPCEDAAILEFRSSLSFLFFSVCFDCGSCSSRFAAKKAARFWSLSSLIAALRSFSACSFLAAAAAFWRLLISGLAADETDMLPAFLLWVDIAVPGLDGAKLVEEASETVEARPGARLDTEGARDGAR